ncbi:DUF2182 domain-containing protein [Polycladidibacter hongkongensis]|uniref:DUF2182 domain-containing protein n=1 Tax=Polycladidibacter hongkongensis TaxID=1647556 RepID=UPI0009EC56C1|nr:DUF2182 domain-containing protein [Pseudovibrio hongkongensis]
MLEASTSFLLSERARTASAYVFLLVCAALGWVYLGFMVADMVQIMDMGAMGPGMQIFNQFNVFAGLPEEVRLQLAALCLPQAASGFGMPALLEPSLRDFALILLMWLMMVLAMMLPTALPMLRAFESARDAGGMLQVAGGYLSAWAAFCLLASGGQYLLQIAGALSPMMAPTLGVFAASTVVFAGIYQFTPLKQACLYRCRVPVVAKAAKAGTSQRSAFAFGVEQGIYCLGCCWALMALMFAVGVMNILWIALLGGVMALEKTVGSRRLSYIIGVVLLAWGGAYLYFTSGDVQILSHLFSRIVAG